MTTNKLLSCLEGIDCPTCGKLLKACRLQVPGLPSESCQSEIVEAIAVALKGQKVISFKELRPALAALIAVLKAKYTPVTGYLDPGVLKLMDILEKDNRFKKCSFDRSTH